MSGPRWHAMSIVLQSVTKRFDHQIVVNDVNLEVQDGEFFVLLGPSGCGKTTALNIIAGLVPADAGRVWLHGCDVSTLPPQARNVGFVFQHYALFEHMTVAENIEFGMTIRRASRADRRSRRDELLELVGLVGFARRMPAQLSGGQQQRVALARALALSPEVLLLDEPLGALDAKIRAELRRTLKSVQRRLGVATILVTHDQEEAFDLADRIGVMSYGRLIETGTPQSLYQNPQTEFVASFLGTANLLLGQAAEGEVCVGGHAFPLPQPAQQLSPDGRVQLLFRPEDIALAPAPVDLGCPSLGEGRVIETGFSGPTERLRIELPAISGVRAIAPAVPFGRSSLFVEASRPPDQSVRFPLAPGQPAWVGIRRLHVLSHPGLSLMIVVDGTRPSQDALVLGGYLSRMSHARVELVGVGADEPALSGYLQDARKLLGSGMASLTVRYCRGGPADAVLDPGAGGPHDLVVVGWRTGESLDRPRELLEVGDHHLFLAGHGRESLNRVLVCVSGGEPAKEDVFFAGRLLRHLGSEVTLLTVVPPSGNLEFRRSLAERFAEAGIQSLKLFGVRATAKVLNGSSPHAIVEEVEHGNFDLVVMGAPLPDMTGQIALDGVVSRILESNSPASYLIVRSHFSHQLEA